jgi:flagellar basal-body rod modification protein FlgD
MPTPLLPTTNTTAAAGTQASNPAGQLTKDDFLKLFVAQMQHQDPSQPMDNSQMMAQMASFSTLEQISNMATANGKVAANMQQSNAISLIGRTVTYLDGAKAEHTGKVEKVSTVKGAPVLTINGVDSIDPASVTQVV